MKRLLLVALLMSSVGCTKIERIVGIEENKPEESQFFIVACCQDSNGGAMSYPSFLPESHVALCQQARKAPDGRIGNDIYLATAVDCGRTMNRIGDEFYVGKGY